MWKKRLNTVRLLCVCLVVCLVGPTTLRSAPPGLPRGVYLSNEKALAEVFPDAKRVEKIQLRFTPQEKRRLEGRCGRRLFEKGFEVFRALGEGNQLTGYAIVTDEIGKYQPITFIVGVSPRARVTRVAVMVYRESIGHEIKRSRFLRQFNGKTTRSPLRVNRDIIHISGATLSSRAIARGVKKVLHTLQECLIGPRRRADVVWHQVDPPPAGDGNVASAPLRKARYLMGTVLEIICYGTGPDIEDASRAAFAEVARLEGLLSRYDAQSEISRVNREAARRAVCVSADTLACISQALEFARQTGGAFDPTLQSGGHEAVVLDRDASTVRFTRPGLRLDLGGIGKGFALDRAARVLETRGVTSVLLNFGGQILALDSPPGKDAWIVPVRDPRDSSASIGYYEVVRASVSTSGAYERGDHVIDPATGKPARRSLSTTVCAPNATAADALSTSIDVLGPRAAVALTAKIPGAAVLVVPADRRPLVRHESAGAPPFIEYGNRFAGLTGK